MTMKCFTLQPEPVFPKGFLALPLELRRQIYEYVLIDIPKWQKRHKATCDFVPRTTNTMERPPFLAKCGYFATHGDRCGCTLRDGLSLLAVNRQIHCEAAEIFWSQNTFFFAPASQFVQDVGQNLRPEYRRMLQHVCIINDMLDADSHFEYYRYESADRALFTTLLACTNLRTIELGHEMLAGNAGFVQRLHTLPRLLSFSLSAVLSYKVMAQGEAAGFELKPHMSGHTVLPKGAVLWFKTGKEINPAAIHSEADLEGSLGDFRTSFLVNLRHEISQMPGKWITAAGKGPGRPHETPAVRRQLRITPEAPPLSPWSAFMSSPVTPVAEMAKISRFFVLQDGPVTQFLTLRDQSECAVEIMGLPLSKATWTQHNRERRRMARTERMAGKKTASEERARAQIAARRAEKAEKKRLSELMEEEKAKKERQERRAQALAEQGEAANDAWNNECEERMQAQLEAQELRRTERKRTWQLSPEGVVERNIEQVEKAGQKGKPGRSPSSRRGQEKISQHHKAQSSKRSGKKDRDYDLEDLWY